MRPCVPFSAFPKEKSMDGERERVAFILKNFTLWDSCVSLVLGADKYSILLLKKKKISIFALLIFSIKICLSSPHPIFYFCFFRSSQTWLTSKYDIAHCSFLKQVPFLPFFIFQNDLSLLCLRLSSREKLSLILSEEWMAAFSLLP